MGEGDAEAPGRDLRFMMEQGEASGSPALLLSVASPKNLSLPTCFHLYCHYWGPNVIVFI